MLNNEYKLKKPIFIIGSPRSGTSWLQKMLISHPDICGGQETHFFRAFGPAIKVFEATERSKRKVGLYHYWDENELFEKIFKLWEKTNINILRSSPNARWFIEKTPDHTLWVPQIIRIIPDAKFIFLIRDSRAVCCSLISASKTQWAKKWAPNNVVSAAQMWKKYIEAAHETLKMVSNEKKIFIKYENISDEPFNSMKKIFNFIGLAVDKEILEEIINNNSFDKLKNIEKETLKTGMGYCFKEPEGFYRKGKKDSWKTELNFLEKRKIWKITKKYMKIYGYQKDGKVIFNISE